MANKRIDELTEATSIASTDLLFVGNPSTGELKKATANLARRLMFRGGIFDDTLAMTDGVTRYFGSFYDEFLQSTEIVGMRFYSPISGTINAAYVHFPSTTAGSGEAWSMYLRVNSTTDTLIQTLSTTDATRIWSNTSMGVSISAGDYFYIKMVNPTWANNPNGAIFCTVFLDY